MDPSVLANMDEDPLRKQIENLKYQASMERWFLSRSIAACIFISIICCRCNPRCFSLYSQWLSDCYQPSSRSLVGF
ncbi:hypothetical protein ANTRET_LOCUS61 [Anthophora retusa]